MDEQEEEDDDDARDGEEVCVPTDEENANVDDKMNELAGESV